MERGGGSAAGASAAKKMKRNGGKKNDNRAAARSVGGASRGPPRGVVPIDQALATSGALRARLASLGATAPSFVIAKPLKKSDVDRNQARLLFSCKRGTLALFPLTACFTELEAQRVEDQHGLLVTALDRGGGSYDLTCRYLDSNFAYRFITGWTAFLEANGLVLDADGSFQRDVHVELWAFRSRQLPNRLVDVGDGKEKIRVREETGHPDGSVGLVLLHYEYGERGGDDRKEEERMDEEAPMPAAAPPLVTRQENLKLAGAGTEQQEAAVPPRRITKDEMVAKYGEKMALAAIGLNMLKKGYWASDYMDKRP